MDQVFGEYKFLGFHLRICVLGKIVIFWDIKTLFERSFFQLLSIYRQLADKWFLVNCFQRVNLFHLILVQE